MKKEKLIATWVLIFLIFINSINIVSAQEQLDQTIGVIYEKVGNAFASIFGPIFDVDQVDEFLFAKVLIFILIFAIVFMALREVKIFKRNKPIRVVVAVIVAILATRYLKETDLVTAILLPYGALGGSLVILLPLLIYFFFVHTSIEGGFGRRFAWFIYGVILLYLWLTREYMGSANWIYIAALIFVLINLIFDKSVHYYFELGKADKTRRKGVKRQMARLKKEINDAIEVGDEPLTEDLQDQLKSLMRKL